MTLLVPGVGKRPKQGEIDRSCEKKAFRNYKFYLSFENSQCEDYLSGE